MSGLNPLDGDSIPPPHLGEALLEFQRKSPQPGDRYVAILTGRRA